MVCRHLCAVGGDGGRHLRRLNHAYQLACFLEPWENQNDSHPKELDRKTYARFHGACPASVQNHRAVACACAVRVRVRAAATAKRACTVHTRVAVTRVVVTRVVKHCDCARVPASVVRRFGALACVVVFVAHLYLEKQSQEEQKTQREERTRTAQGGWELRNCALVPADMVILVSVVVVVVANVVCSHACFRGAETLPRMHSFAYWTAGLACKQRVTVLALHCQLEQNRCTDEN